MAQPPKEDLVLQFLSGLPSHDPKNFQKFANKEPKESVTKKPKTYVSTRDTEPSQYKTNILLRYLRQKSERENNEGKDKGSPRPKNPPPKSNDEFVSPWKRPRRD